MKTVFIFVLLTIVLSARESDLPDTTGFFDSAHHWYDIHEEDRIIQPLPGQRRYNPDETESIADNIILFQKNNGGWAKNYDMRAVLTENQKQALLNSKNDTNTTFDNGTTHSHITYLAEVYSITKREEYREACLRGIEFVLQAQYRNGGFPQFYPDTSGYKKYITFNDGAMTGVMQMLHKIASGSPEFSFIGSDMRNKIKGAYQKGIDCILKCQIEENDTLYAWCQQHDNIDFRPRPARTFEPAAICNGESAAIVKFLMNIENPSDEVIEAVNCAVAWFEKSKITGLRYEMIKAPHADYQYHSTEHDMIVVNDPDAPPVWARFYEPGTHKPLFCNRDGVIVYSLAEVERERRTGYAWYVYDPAEILRQYPEWQKKLAGRKNDG